SPPPSPPSLAVRAARAPWSRCRALWPRARRGSPCSTRPSSAPIRWCSRRRRLLLLRGQPGPRRRALPLVDLLQGLGLVPVIKLPERVLALDVAERAEPALLVDELVQVARLPDVLGHVRRERRRHLAVLRE